MALITAQEIVNQGILKAAPINQRFDAALLAPHINIAESRHLKSILCSAFYNDLVSQKDGTGQYNSDLGTVTAAYTTNANYETLYKDYILPYMAICVLDQALPMIGVQIGSAGVYAHNSDFGTNEGIEGIKYIQEKLRSDIQVLRQSLLDYLCENKAVYALFCSGDCPDESCEDSDTALTNDLGIIFY